MSDVTIVASAMLASFAIILFIGAAFVLIAIMDRRNKLFFVGSGLSIIAVMFIICLAIGFMKS